LRFLIRDPPAGTTTAITTVIAYLISGKVRIQSGEGGSIITEPSSGDLVHIEPGTVHQETYEGEIATVGFTVGSGPGRVDVAGPEGS
jgi:uncharacterized RmlC-like cupin family protein